MKLPRRTRAHILEELSVDKFKKSLPLEWVYRTPTHDYGIDGEVEVFDEDGLSTGIKFLVQLKATDDKVEKKALKLRMAIEKLNYFKQLDTPILIVRYLAQTDFIYCRWFHSLNPTTDTKAEKSFVMQFSEDCKWSENSSKYLLDQLKSYKNFGSKQLSKPTIVDISILTHTGLGMYSAHFVSNLISSAKENESIFAFKIKLPKEPTTPTFIEIHGNDYYVNLGGVGSFRGTFGTLNNKSDTLALVADINVSIALLLQSLGHTKEAEVHFNNSIITSTIKNKGMILVSYVKCKIDQRATLDALEFIEHLAVNYNVFKNGLIHEIQLSLGLITGLSVGAEINKVKYVYETLISAAPLEANLFRATAYYNIGNFLSAKHEHRLAVRYYLKAARENPDYKKRIYWLEELAGLFFLIRKYKASSKLYDSLVKIKDTPEIKVLLADSLFLSGSFEMSLKLLDESIPYLEKRNSIWCLKKWLLDTLVDGLGIKNQVIGRPATQNFIKNSSEEEVWEYIENVNALCPECWFFIATKFAVNEKYSKACTSFLLSAFSDENYKDTWMKALQCSFRIEDLTVFNHLVEIVVSKFGSETISELFFHISEQLDGKLKDDLSEVTLQLIKHCEDYNMECENNEYKIRFGDSASMETIPLKR